MPTSPSPTALPDLSGATAVITGANTGLGLATARALAGAGARVVLAVRDLARGHAAAASIAGDTDVRELDLARLDSIREFATSWTEPIDLLINNAAAVPPTHRRQTADGFELQFGTDHLGHFALTNRLLEHVTGRVVTVASQAERMGRLDLDDLGWERRAYGRSRAYNTAKLANLLFTAELARRLADAGSPVRAMAAHPGFVVTDIYRESGRFASWLVRRIGQGPAQGALPVLSAALDDLPSDSFIGPEHLMHMRGGAEPIGRSARARDPELARRLWDASERLTGVSWPLQVPSAAR